MNVNQTAFCVTTALGVATIASAVAAATTTASTVAIVAYSILSLTSAATTTASITAWIATHDKSVHEYFTTMGDHLMVTIPGYIKFASEVLVRAVINGIGEGISKLITRKMAGDDVTISVSRR